VAFDGSTVVWVKTEPPELRQGLGGCGAFTLWQVEQALAEKPPEKSEAWQIWQEIRLPPVTTFAAILARTPWMVGSENPGLDWWWHPVVKQVGMPLPTLIMEIS
jgi:hypothetical protein